MSSGVATFSASSAPAAIQALAIAEFLTTGSTSPTYSTAPTYRTGSANTQTFNATASLGVTLSSNIQVGDFIILAIATSSNTQFSVPNLPPGFNLIGYQNDSVYPNMWVYGKFAVAGDPGSTVTFNTTFGYNWSCVTAAYSGVNPYVPVNIAIGSYYNTTSTTYTSPSYTTALANTAIVEIASCAGSTTLTAPTNSRTSGGANNNAIAIADQSQATAGATTGQTFTAGAASTWRVFTLALTGVATTSSTAPLGGWTMVDWYSPASQSYQNLVFKTPAASNNVSSDWYYVIQYNNYGTGFTVTGCETYSTSAHTWNACFAMNTSTTPTSPSGSTTPPYAIVATVANTVGTYYTGQYSVSLNPTSGTNNLFIAANKDGIFLSLYGASTYQGANYFGAGTTLVSNSNLTDPVPLFCGSFNTNGSVTFGTTREPGWPGTTGTYFGAYTSTPFAPTGPGYTTFVGYVNGTMTSNDLFQAPATQPIASRWMLYRYSGGSLGYYQVGCIRGLLPSWIQYVLQTSCNWGDTATESPSGDTLTYYGGGSYNGVYLWIDTTAA